jgi:hypothetical protein
MGLIDRKLSTVDTFFHSGMIEVYTSKYYTNLLNPHHNAQKGGLGEKSEMIFTRLKCN